uniref:Flagellar FliJ protein n=1 Tax=Strongyloides venezuelensis TaxID=75913 RepID=A0A0K0F8A7_STRVS
MTDLNENCTGIVKIEEKLHEETKGIISNKYKNIYQKIGNYKKEEWEDEVKKLKNMNFINYDMIMIMNLSKTDDFKNFKNFSLAKEQNLVFNFQQKMNQLEAQKMIFENIKKKEIKTQENKLENELTQRKTNKGSYNFE